MSDSNDAEQHDGHDEECDQPGCLYHRLMSARVRAVTDSQEVYVNAHDLASFIALWHAYGLTMTAHEAAESMPQTEEVQQTLFMAIANQNEAAKGIVEMVHNLAHDDIKPLSDLEGTLVSPQDMRNVPDTIPAEWVHEKESQ